MSKKRMNRDNKWYYKIDEQHTEYGLFELWENEEYGEVAEAMLTLDGNFCCWTWDDIGTAIDLYEDEI